ncbi:acyl-UDP-N-acetylglucosamine O-acyltransferase [Tasmannia lanceolata]|uniref:acyl-UDP-N-acetylglucosamine O-acyltransferase n=1 Tax=Tasmannia lanceolata TaxID=3420 RepID=UPI0040646DC0
MAAGRELGFPKTGGCSLREVIARATLRGIRNQGHLYVELREDGKRFIFFCTLCLSPCYSDSILFDHLKGNLHRQRYAAAKVTLFGTNPWPFNDGVFFFHDSSEKERQQLVVLDSHEDRIMNTNSNNHGVIVSSQDKNTKSNGNCATMLDGYGCDMGSTSNGCSSELVMNGHDKISNVNYDNHQMVIPGVLINDEVSILGIKFLGVGHIASRIFETNEISEKVNRIWCAWLGEGESGDGDMFLAPDSDFAIINFSYTYDLGRKAVMNDLSLLSSYSPDEEMNNSRSNRKKRTKSFSEPEDMLEAFSDHCGQSLVLSNSTEKALTSNRYDDQLQHSTFRSNKHVRRELRRQNRLAAERMCDVCQQRMLPGKDVATLFNRRTGSLACSSRNTNGAFHVFHASCLVHWLLLCELEMWTGQSSNAKVSNRSSARGCRRKRGANSSKMRMSNGKRATRTHISSVLCPECQGTGMNIEGDEMEKPTIPLSEMFLYKIKAIESHKAWMRNPEILQKCSTGLHLPCGSGENFQEKVLPLKLLHFYRAIQ